MTHHFAAGATVNERSVRRELRPPANLGDVASCERLRQALPCPQVGWTTFPPGPTGQWTRGSPTELVLPPEA